MTAPEILDFSSPFLRAFRRQRKVIAHDPRIRYMILQSALQRSSLPEALREQAVVNILLDVIVVLLFAAPTVEIVRQADHVIDDTVLLIHIAQSGRLAVRRSPALSIRLPSGSEASPPVHSQFPVVLHYFSVSLLSRHFIGSGTSVNLRNRRVGVHIGEDIRPI